MLDLIFYSLLNDDFMLTKLWFYHAQRGLARWWFVQSLLLQESFVFKLNRFCGKMDGFCTKHDDCYCRRALTEICPEAAAPRAARSAAAERRGSRSTASTRAAVGPAANPPTTDLAAALGAPRGSLQPRAGGLTPRSRSRSASAPPTARPARSTR